MSAGPVVSVVVCAYNEEDWIANCLESLSQQERLPDEVVVVDNNSTDATAQIVHDYASKYPQLNIHIVHETKQGLHHAREGGWRAATSDIVAMSDADITPSSANFW